MSKIWLILLASFSIAFGQTEAEEAETKKITEADTKLLLVQMIFRHGDRSPMLLYPTDPNTADIWTEGFGKLTLTGRKQHYLLGKFLRKRYDGFVTSNPNEVLVNSTAFDRCMRSAESNLASFYAPTANFTFVEEINWQPIPVYYIPSEYDRYLAVMSDCPRAFDEHEKISASPEFVQGLKKYKPMLENVTALSGLNNLESMILLQDTIAIEKRYGQIIPEWVEQYWDELTEFSNFYFFWAYNSDLMQRLRAGPLIGKIIENMTKKILGKNPDLKVQVYSAHDANIVVVLEALKLYERRPPYAAAVLFEMHEIPNGQKAVRIVYVNSTQPEVEGSHETHVLILDGCSEFCPLEYFIAYTFHLIPQDWERECQLGDTTGPPIDPEDIEEIIYHLFFEL